MKRMLAMVMILSIVLSVLAVFTPIAVASGRVIDVFGGASNLGYGSGYPGPFPAPYGGQGPNTPMDLVFPESNVTLFVNVTYNDEPVPSVDVTFELNGPSSSAILNATTDTTGTASVTYSMPWSALNPEYFTGLWTVTANATMSGLQVSDELSFYYDYAVRMFRVTTEAYYYSYGDFIHCMFTYGTRASQYYSVLFVVDLENSSGVPFNVFDYSTSVGGNPVFGGWYNSTAFGSLYIPFLSGLGGYSYVHVNCYDKDPSVGGVQLCPEYAPPLTVVVGSFVSFGSNVTVSLPNNLELTFANVTAAGYVSAQETLTVFAPPLTNLVGEYCDVMVTASYSGNVTVSLAFDGSNMTQQEKGNLTMMQYTPIPGDIQPAFGKVDMRDIGYIARRFGTDAMSPLWDPAADITGPTYLVPDGKVDMRDIGLCARNFGNTSQWINITTYVDTTNNITYGNTTHFSLIGIHK